MLFDDFSVASTQHKEEKGEERQDGGTVTRQGPEVGRSQTHRDSKRHDEYAAEHQERVVGDLPANPGETLGKEDPEKQQCQEQRLECVRKHQWAADLENRRTEERRE